MAQPLLSNFRVDAFLEQLAAGQLGGFAAVQVAASQVGGDTLLDFGGGDTVTLIGVDVASLHENNFLI